MSRCRNRVSIRDVAKVSGYSTYTVSSVLNEQGDIPAETAAKVNEVADRLGYKLPHPKRIGKEIARQSIGLVLPNTSCMNHGFYSRAMITVRTMATLRNIDCKLFTEEDVLERLLVKTTSHTERIGCCGVIVFCPIGDFQTYIKKLLSHDIAVGLIRREMELQPGLFIAQNHDYEEITSLLEYLQSRCNVKRIAYINGSTIRKNSPPGRRTAVRDFASALPGNNSFLKLQKIPEPSSKECSRLNEFIKSNPERQAAVICWTDDEAIQMSRLLQASGLRVPDDVLITGYNNDPISGMTYPSLTTMNVPVEEMVTAACRYLFEHRDVAHMPPPVVREFKHELIVRESTQIS